MVIEKAETELENFLNKKAKEAVVLSLRKNSKKVTMVSFLSFLLLLQTAAAIYLILITDGVIFFRLILGALCVYLVFVAYVISSEVLSNIATRERFFNQLEWTNEFIQKHPKYGVALRISGKI